MKRWRSFVALLRVELRQLSRNRGRTLLVAALVALPVAAIVAASTLQHVTMPTAEEERVAALGNASARVALPDVSSVERAREIVGERARVVAVRSGRIELGGAPAALVALDAAELEPGGLAEGLLAIERGRAPADDREIALSPAVLDRLGADVGATVRLVDRDARVTGVVVRPESLRAEIALATEVPDGSVSWLLDTRGEPAGPIVEQLRAAEMRAVDRSELEGSDGFEQLVVFVVGSIGLFEAALVIATAFAIGLRRRQREIGLLGSTGASAGGMRAAVLVSTAVLALIAGAVGVVLGVTGAALLHPHLDGWNGRRNGPLDLPALAIAGAVMLGVVTAVGAAALPVRTATRLPVRVALGMRRPITTPARRWLWAGTAIVAAGGVMLAIGARADGPVTGLALIAGSVLGVLGLGACSPWVLDRCARLAAPLPLAWRLAVRDAGRFRVRNGPVITAVLAGMAISVTVAAMLASVRAMPGFSAEGDDAFYRVVFIACLVTGLVVLAIATALSSVESAADTRVLTTVGAPPSVRRSLLAARTGYLALLGCVLAIPAGMIPAAGLVSIANVPLELRVPWTEVCITVLALPVTAYCGAWLCAAAVPERRTP